MQTKNPVFLSLGLKIIISLLKACGGTIPIATASCSSRKDTKT